MFLKKYLKNDGTFNSKVLRKGTKFATKIKNYYKYQNPRRLYDIHYGDTPKAKKKEEKVRKSIKRKQDKERARLPVELDKDKVLSRYNKDSETFHKLRNARLEISQRRQQVGDEAVQILKSDNVVPIPVAAIFASYGVQRILSDDVLNQKISELETYKEQYRKETYDFLEKYTSKANINPIYLENMAREMTNFAANANKSSGDYTKKDLKKIRMENAKNLSRANPHPNV